MRSIAAPSSEKLTHETTKRTSANNEASKKRSKEDWHQLITQWQHSGLSRKAFCEQHHIKLHTFTYHRNRMRQGQRKAAKFAPVHITSENKAFVSQDRFILQCQNGIKLSIPPQYNPASLKTLLRLLEVLPC